MTPDQEALVKESMWLVRRLADRAKCCLPKLVDIEDLISAGNVGLVKAALKFEPKRGVPFGAYARVRIRGEIQDYLRRQSRISRYARAKGMREPVVMSFNEPTCYDRETLEDNLHDDQPRVEDVAERSNYCEKIIGIFEGRDRRIFEMLHIDGLTLKAVSAIIGVSETRVCVISQRLLATARERICDWTLDAAS